MFGTVDFHVTNYSYHVTLLLLVRPYQRQGAGWMPGGPEDGLQTAWPCSGGRARGRNWIPSLRRERSLTPAPALRTGLSLFCPFTSHSARATSGWVDPGPDQGCSGPGGAGRRQAQKRHVPLPATGPTASSAGAQSNLKSVYPCRRMKTRVPLRPARCGRASLLPSEVLLPRGWQALGGGASRGPGPVRGCLAAPAEAGFCSPGPQGSVLQGKPGQRGGVVFPATALSVPGWRSWAAGARRAAAPGLAACCFHVFGEICWRTWTRSLLQISRFAEKNDEWKWWLSRWFKFFLLPFSVISLSASVLHWKGEENETQLLPFMMLRTWKIIQHSFYQETRRR